MILQQGAYISLPLMGKGDVYDKNNNNIILSSISSMTDMCLLVEAIDDKKLSDLVIERIIDSEHFYIEFKTTKEGYIGIVTPYGHE